MTKLNCFQDLDLWKSFQEKFVNWTRRDFELTSISCCRAFRIYLRRKEVWIFKETTFAKSLYDVFKKRILTSWTEDEIKRCLSEMRFTFYLINSYLKELSDELLQRQKHEVIIDHEKFMTERYSQSSSSSENQSTDRHSFLITENLKHFDELLDELSNESLNESSDELSDESSDESLDEFSVESSVKLSVKSSVKLSVESSVKLLVESSDGLSVEQSFKSSISSFSSAHSSVSLISVNQLRGQSFKSLRSFAPLISGSQSMNRAMSQLMKRLMSHLMRQLMKYAKFIQTTIHRRCGIEWIESTLLNETEQWLLNNRANHLFKSDLSVWSKGFINQVDWYVIWPHKISVSHVTHAFYI